MDAAVHLKHLVFHGRGGLWSQPREVIAVVDGIGGWSVFGPDAPPCSRPWRRDPLWLCILLAGCLLLLSGCAVYADPYPYAYSAPPPPPAGVYAAPAPVVVAPYPYWGWRWHNGYRRG